MGRVGEYQLQAAIAAVHDRAARADDTDWPQILALYGLLEQMTGNPVVTLNRAVAAAMADGPSAGLAVLDGMDESLAGHHRLEAVRAHLLEMAGDTDAALEHYSTAASRTTNLPEQRYLTEGRSTTVTAMSAMPDFIEPMLATLVAGPFDDPDFLFENKWDGFRVQAVVRDGVVRTWTRGRQDAEGYFGPFLVPPTWIDASEAIVDGEVIALDAAGEPSFALLGDPRGRLVYEAFDLLWLDGESLLDRPLEERKELLRSEAARRTRASATPSTSSATASTSTRRPRSAGSRASWRRTVAPCTCRASARGRGAR